MASVHQPDPVKYFVAVLYKQSTLFTRALEEIEKRWGEIDYQGDDHHFDVTDYYESEMGEPLQRRLVSLKELRNPKDIVEVKLQCNQIEFSLCIEGKRGVNLDAGYLDHNKTLLASAKEAGQKVYLDKGIYADLAGRYRGGRYRSFEWSFPDFRDGRYDNELLAIRATYLVQLKEYRKSRA
ncbi:DUF4416 family protein [Chitinispirillales bacterium ANBcel5]|uniref:DUF4416 family protein n=1 Tax=Cellulosispirillum alkaliphilum TaxID=3039283 RepID=UPI002A548217|nr:DUF4416 family protein [Chitinispirillales bacterium ANBcel5]